MLTFLSTVHPLLVHSGGGVLMIVDIKLLEEIEATVSVSTAP